MYAVVGCSACRALWVVDGRPETTGCPRCGKRHRFDALKKFATAEDAATAKQARSALLAKRQGAEDAFASIDAFDDLEADLDAVGTSDEEYLTKSGIDADEVAGAKERAMGGQQSRSRREVVRDSLAELDEPDAEAVVAYASEHGVPPDYVRKALEKLRRSGDVIRTSEGFRLV